MSYQVDGVVVYYYGDSELEELTNIRSSDGKPQVYRDIRNQKGFVDPEFPPNDKSAGQVAADSANPDAIAAVSGKTIIWKRPKEFVAAVSGEEYTPIFAQTGIHQGEDVFSKYDFKQGSIGDCGVVSSMSTVLDRAKRSRFTIPDDNFNNYDSGAYHFRLFRHDVAVDVVVDDYLPCFEKNGSIRPYCIKPALEKGSTNAEIWPALLEKAYAKLKGSFQEIAGTFAGDAVEDLIGGIQYAYRWVPPESQKVEPHIWNMLWDYFRDPKGANAAEFDTCEKTAGGNGIVEGHAYALTGIAKLDNGTRLLRLRNPWGQGEWKGAWSDSSPEWKSVSDAKKQEIGLVVANDGEFWISYEDLLLHFSGAYLVFDFETFAQKFGENSTALVQHGKWSSETGTAGGRSKIWENPQYWLNVGGNDAADADKDYAVLINFKMKPALQKDYYTYCYAYELYPVKNDNFEWGGDGVGYPKEFFQDPDNARVCMAKDVDQEEKYGFYYPGITNLLTLKPGNYVIALATWDENVNEKFCLRVWTQA